MKRLKVHMADLSKASFDESTQEIYQRLMVARGITTKACLDHRLSSMPEPNKMKGMETAVELLKEALASDQRILILGDYDADGATASALAVRALKAMGSSNVDFLVPNRFDYGYGLSPEIAEVALKFTPDLVITVDNGISSVEGVQALREQDVRVIVTDHHLPGDRLPDANAILNPNQNGCDFPSKNLAGVGVLFYLMIALRRRLRELDWFEQNSITEPRLESFLDLVALGTVADLVPMDRINRLLVTNGLKRIRSENGNPGIKSLFEIAGRNSAKAVSSDLGFVVGPRINAAGRLDDISEGIRCLLADEASIARELALNLHHTNIERRQIQAEMTGDAINLIDDMLKVESNQLAWGLCVYQPNWHQGVVGLVASKLKENMHRPAIAFAKANTDQADSAELKGSARSIAGLHMRDLLDRIATKHPGLIVKFGGHAMAAGLSLSETNYDTFAEVFDQEVHAALSEDDFEAVIWSDGELGAEHLSLEFARSLSQLLPWGQALSEPIFHGRFRIQSMRWLKETHLKLVLILEEEERVLNAIWFSAIPSSECVENATVQLAYRLSVNEYRGQESLQLMIVDEVSV